MVHVKSMLHVCNILHVHGMLNDGHSMLHSTLHVASVSPSSSASCDTSTTNSALCTSRASCPDTNSSDGHKTHHAKQPKTQHTALRQMEHATVCGRRCSTRPNKIRTSISHVVTSESWLMASGTPHRNENMICR
jgi:hypothetical protein